MIEPGPVTLECYDENGEMYHAPGWMSIHAGGTRVEFRVLTEAEVMWSDVAQDMIRRPD